MKPHTHRINMHRTDLAWAKCGWIHPGFPALHLLCISILGGNIFFLCFFVAHPFIKWYYSLPFPSLTPAPHIHTYKKRKVDLISVDICWEVFKCICGMLVHTVCVWVLECLFWLGTQEGGWKVCRLIRRAYNYDLKFSNQESVVHASSSCNDARALVLTVEIESMTGFLWKVKSGYWHERAKVVGS